MKTRELNYSPKKFYNYFYAVPDRYGRRVISKKMKTENTIEQFYTYYNTNNLCFNRQLNSDDIRNNSFTLKLRLKRLPKKGETIVLCEIPSMLKICSVGYDSARSADIKKNASPYEQGELLFQYADETGCAPALRAELYMHSEEHPDWDMFSLSVPLRLYNAAEKDIFLRYDGVRLSYIFDGEEVNAEYPFGSLNEPDAPLYVAKEELCDFGVSLQDIETKLKSETLKKSISFYSPRGYNTWAGDVVNYYKDGVYYLLYFFDRHHHASRKLCGAHCMRLLTTRDFVHWIDHGQVTEVKEQWQTVGTGTMFFYKGKFYYCHGYHTGRMLPENRLGSAVLMKEYEKYGFITAHSYEEFKEKGLFPNGANYAVSDDGIHFKEGGKQFHWAENPSIYEENGKLAMYCGFGTWEAEDIDGKWYLKDKDFPPSGANTDMKNTAECPSFFEWNGYRYLMMGWTGFWQTEKGGGAFIDTAISGYDVYDGLGVPMAVKTADNRAIIAGWLYGHGWGSLIVHRELLQFEDGRLGMRWLPECAPSPEKDDLIYGETMVKNGACFALEPRRSYYMEIEVLPEENGAVAVGFAGDGKPCRLLVDSGAKTVEINILDKAHVFDGERILPPHLLVPKLCGDALMVHQLADADIPCRAKNFCLANMRGVDKPYMLKIILHYEKKTDSVFVDAEIAGVRTLVSNRVGLNVNEISLYAEGAKIAFAAIYRSDG